jgi:hypothetical protein
MASKDTVFVNTEEMLSMAERGLADALGQDPTRRRAGVMNLFTYGRSVTLAIQGISSSEPAFAKWWKPYQDWMAGDPLMKFFNDTRVAIVHRGELATSTSMVIGGSEPVDLGAVMREVNRHAPPNTIGTFLGEGSTGGHGWEVRMPDGSVEKVYFSIPGSVDIRSALHLADPPTEHDGQPISDTSIANLGAIYLAALRRVVGEFKARFA